MRKFEWINEIPPGDWEERECGWQYRIAYDDFVARSGYSDGETWAQHFKIWAGSQPGEFKALEHVNAETGQKSLVVIVRKSLDKLHI